MPETKKYYHNLDVDNNKVINLLLNPLTTAQRTAVGGLLGPLDEGYVCFDTTLNQQYFWDGTAWINVVGSTTWGSITGTITAQTDLTAYLAANYYPLSSNPANYIDLTDLSAGTGISYNNLTGVITNSAPDQTVGLTAGSGISVTGTYPNFTISNTGSLTVPNLQSVLNVGNSATDKQISLTDSVSNITSILGSVLQFNDNTNSYQGIYEASGFSLYNVTTANSFSLYNTGLVPAIFYNASTVNFPTASGTFALSVNGVGAAADGSVTIPVGTGTVTGVTATSPITSSGGTAPDISTSMSTNRLIGRTTAGTGVMEEISVGTGLSLSGGTLSATAQVPGFEQHFLLMGA